MMVGIRNTKVLCNLRKSDKAFYKQVAFVLSILKIIIHKILRFWFTVFKKLIMLRLGKYIEGNFVKKKSLVNLFMLKNIDCCIPKHS